MVFTSKFKESIPPKEYQNSLSLFYWRQLDKFADKTLFVDYASGRRWTGRSIKTHAIEFASYLVGKLNLKPGEHTVFFYPNSDQTHLAALGVLFAGGSVCAGALDDPRSEHEYMVRLMRPKVVFADVKILEELKSIRNALEEEDPSSTFKICILSEQVTEFDTAACYSYRDIYMDMPNSTKQSQQANNLPVLVDPDQAAYVLLTSGSTGKPKPVARSHRNSLYVCFCLDTCNEELWNLSEQSVFAGHLPLDHGTGTFSIKLTLARGMTLIIMETYYEQMLLKAIDKYKITDCILGSALLHNLMSRYLDESTGLAREFNLGSLRNMISVGSPIASHELSRKFMNKHQNELSVRQSLGMTECGFVCFVRRADCLRESRAVGWLLPNMEAKLIDLDSGEEIGQSEKEGELYVRGPTVSPGYIGDKYKEQQRAAFLADGFYKTFDLAKFSSEGELVMRGRCNDVLCLGDGWKVLPNEIEAMLMTHEGILEAAVVGIPNPELPTCHAPRAYVVPKPNWQDKLTELDVIEYAKRHSSEPKHLVGGVKVMRQGLPRISIGKVDKRQLKQADGY